MLGGSRRKCQLRQPERMDTSLMDTSLGRQQSGRNGESSGENEGNNASWPLANLGTGRVARAHVATSNAVRSGDTEGSQRRK